MREQEIHNALIAWLKKEKIPFIRSRMDKRTSTACGDPDFACFRNGRACLLEIKAGGNKLSLAQVARIGEFASAGTTVWIATSVEQAIDFVRHALFGQTNGVNEVNQYLTILANESKFYIADSNAGSVVIAKNQDGQWGAIRMATAEDMKNFPRRTEAVK